MNTAEQRILAKPEVWCSSASPGGGTYSVSSSSSAARASIASRGDRLPAAVSVSASLVAGL